MRLQKRLYILVTIWVTIRGNTEHLGMARLPLSFYLMCVVLSRSTNPTPFPRGDRPEGCSIPASGQWSQLAFQNPAYYSKSGDSEPQPLSTPGPSCDSHRVPS